MSLTKIKYVTRFLMSSRANASIGSFLLYVGMVKFLIIIILCVSAQNLEALRHDY